MRFRFRLDRRLQRNTHLSHFSIGGFAKRAHPAQARYLNVNVARRNRDLQPGGKEIEEGGGGGGEEEEEKEEKEAKEEKSGSW